MRKPILQKDPHGQFFRIRPSLWGLTQRRRQILRKLKLTRSASSHAQQQFNHTYYQAILLEIGNSLNYHTAVARQDKNREFIGKKLGEIASLRDIPKFTYEPLVREARNIDVIWFKEHSGNCLFPSCFFEIEPTTDFNRSLLKFDEFACFAAKFYIVADASREKRFRSTLSRRTFQHLHGMVEFLAYEELENDHESLQNSQRLRVARLMGQP
ncbi:MAG: hypothetical protein ACK4ME_09260 [Fimbriimonadales bacterium]